MHADLVSLSKKVMKRTYELLNIWDSIYWLPVLTGTDI